MDLKGLYRQAIQDIKQTSNAVYQSPLVKQAVGAISNFKPINTYGVPGETANPTLGDIANKYINAWNQQNQNTQDYYNAYGKPGATDEQKLQAIRENMAPVLGAIGGISDIKAPIEGALNVLREGQEPIGQVMDETLARARFNIPNLTRLSGGGSDRDVFDLGNSILKIAKTARGLAQNRAGQDYYAAERGLIPNIKETGSNYTIFDKMNPPDANTKAMLKKLSDLQLYRGNPNFYEDTQKAFDIMEKHGYPGNQLANYGEDNLMWDDLRSLRNWGTTPDGKPILLDDGTLGGNSMLHDYMGVQNMQNPEFRNIYNQNRSLKSQFGDTDKYTMYGLSGGLMPLALQSLNNQKKQ